MIMDAEETFLQWLVTNGATFPKIHWPAITPMGSRGVIALDDIACMEPILCIPKHLIISEKLCLEHPLLGSIFAANQDVFCRDDAILAFYLVHELVQGSNSFFYPYLNILPQPITIQDWEDEELDLLYDKRLIDVAYRRVVDIETFYTRIFKRLDIKYKGYFPRKDYTFERFQFAWKTIQSRSFGRRLPWTALVPFADCLNHANISTKYDYNVNDNGCFRLYSTNQTCFQAGNEVFNSYGRRSNFDLLLDYGFALEENEWDTVDINISQDKIIDLQQRSCSAYVGLTKSSSTLPKYLRLKIAYDSTIDSVLPTTFVAIISIVTADSNLETRKGKNWVIFVQWVRDVIHNRQQQFKEALDCLTLHKKNPTEVIQERITASLNYQKNRKSILDSFLNLLDAMIEELTIE